MGIYARDYDNCILTVYPYHIRHTGRDSEVTRVIIALNPDLEQALNYTLLPLAEMLEQSEQMEENASFIVREAELITFSEKNDRLLSERITKRSRISFGELYRITLSSLENKKNTDYVFAMVKIDPAALKYSNAILKVCCLNMVGKGNSTMNDENIFYLDYRTCFYADQSVAVLAAVDVKNKSLSSLIKGDILHSPICVDLKNLLEQKQELRAIGLSVSEKVDYSRYSETEIEGFNTRLVKLSARIQKDDLITNPVEQEIYIFMKNILSIMPLKESVVTSAELLIRNAEQKRDHDSKEARERREERAKAADEAEKRRDNRIQAIMSLLALFSISSALVDCFDFISKFNSRGEWSQLNNILKSIDILLFVLIGVVSVVAVCSAIKAIKAAWEDNDKKR